MRNGTQELHTKIKESMMEFIIDSGISEMQDQRAIDELKNNFETFWRIVQNEIDGHS